MWDVLDFFADVDGSIPAPPVAEPANDNAAKAVGSMSSDCIAKGFVIRDAISSGFNKSSG